jgi:peptide-methionine (R)-S-oxide reductase
MQTLQVQVGRNGEVVAYCDCPDEATSTPVALQLLRAGYERVAVVRGGFQVLMEEEGAHRGEVRTRGRSMTRRQVLGGIVGISGVIVLSTWALDTGEETMASTETFEISKSEAEWRKVLTPEQFNVLRQHGTERPRSSPLDKEYGRGTYVCAACVLPLFSSDTKYDSGTGWPSFWAPIDRAVRTSRDWTLLLPRTEVHCRRCGGHLGHVFTDGPQPTGQRYCMNGVALTFVRG